MVHNIIYHRQNLLELKKKTLLLKLSFIRASSFNRPEFVVLLEEFESAHDEIIHHTYMKWLSLG